MPKPSQLVEGDVIEISNDENIYVIYITRHDGQLKLNITTENETEYNIVAQLQVQPGYERHAEGAIDWLFDNIRADIVHYPVAKLAKMFRGNKK